MASITIRNLDEALKAQLRVRAARHGRSMEEEVRVMLREALENPPAASQGFNEGGRAFTAVKSLGELIHERFAEAGGFEPDLPPREKLPPPVEFDE